MYNYFISSLVLLIALFSQNDDCTSYVTEEGTEFLTYADNSRSDVLIRYYRNGIAVHYKATGEFAYCQVCLDGLASSLPGDEVVANASVTVDFNQGTVQVFDADNNLVKSFVNGSTIYGSTIYGIGHAIGYYPTQNQDFTYLGTNTGNEDPPVLVLSCQCVPMTSTPCGPNGEDIECDVGGELSTSCSVSTGVSAGGGMQIIGTGASGSGGLSQGCSISCLPGVAYACCSYE